MSLKNRSIQSFYCLPGGALEKNVTSETVPPSVSSRGAEPARWEYKRRKIVKRSWSVRSRDHGGWQVPRAASRRDDGVVSVWVWSLTAWRPRKSPCVSSSPKAGNGWCPGWKATWPEESRPALERIRFLFYLGLPLLRAGTPTSGRGQPARLSPLMEMRTSSRNNLIETPRVMFDQVSGHPKAQSSWRTKLTFTSVHED